MADGDAKVALLPEDGVNALLAATPEAALTAAEEMAGQLTPPGQLVTVA